MRGMPAWAWALALGALASSAAADLRVDSVRFDPALPTSADAVSATISGAAFKGFLSTCELRFLPPRLDGRTVRIVVDASPSTPCPPPGPAIVTLPLPALAYGSYRLTIEDGALLVWSGSLMVGGPGPDVAFLNRLSARLTWQPVGSPTPQAASAVTLGENAAYFWFTSPSNVEVVVKVLDGRLVNGHFWIFVSSLTRRAFTLQVVGPCTTPGCSGSALKSYSAAAGHNQNFIDLNAF